MISRNEIKINSASIKSVSASKTAALLIDVENSEIDDEHKEKTAWYYQQIIDFCLPNIKRIIQIGRSFGSEIIYMTAESLIAGGRDRSLDHKLSNIFIPTWIELLMKLHLKKTIYGLKKQQVQEFFIQLYIEKSRKIRCLLVMGMLTDQCVDMTIRGAADKAYRVICISDA